jgi:biotin carboxyl carrier protein
MIKATVNNTSSFEVENMLINGIDAEADLIMESEGVFHVIKNNRSFRVVVTHVNRVEKLVQLTINNKTFEVKLKDKTDLLLEKMGISNSTSSKVNQLKAPMPGLILSIDVKEGDSISKGDKLLILEAMKMENVIKAPADAVVKRIAVKTKEAVEKGQLLIEFE